MSEMMHIIKRIVKKEEKNIGFLDRPHSPYDGIEVVIAPICGRWQAWLQKPIDENPNDPYIDGNEDIEFIDYDDRIELEREIWGTVEDKTLMGVLQKLLKRLDKHVEI